VIKATKMQKIPLLLIFTLTSALSLASDYNIIDFGARADTTYVSTKAIQSAIDTCNKNGGGTVIVPAGNFITGTIILKSNVHLHLKHGATLYGSRKLEDYLEIKPRYIALRTKEKTRQLIYAEDQNNIAITGSGTIDGQGASFKRKRDGDEGIERPHLLQFINCKRVRIQDISMRNSGAWMQHYLACEDLKITGIEVYNHSNYNNDGLDIDGCRNVTVSGVTIDSDDDGICLKSTSGRPSENISISNCVISSHCNGLKMGTESSGGFKNITIGNCVVTPSAVDNSTIYGNVMGISGISLEMVDGGVLRGVNISNIQIDGTQSPIFIRLANRARPFSEAQGKIEVGSLSDVMISNINITNALDFGCSITGIPGYPVKNVRLSDISIETAGKGTVDDFQSAVPEKDKDYPEATMFGKLPAYGFFIRHAENVEMNNVRYSTTQPDFRPALYLNDVKRSSFNDATFPKNPDALPAVFVEQSSDILFDGCSDQVDFSAQLLKQENSRNIKWEN